jgi:hypothetical protein
MRPRRGANMLVPVGWLNAASTRGPQRPSGTNPAIGTVTGALTGKWDVQRAGGSGPWPVMAV